MYEAVMSVIFAISAALTAYLVFAFSGLAQLLGSRHRLAAVKKQHSKFSPIFKNENTVNVGAFSPYFVILIIVLFITGRQLWGKDLGGCYVPLFFLLLMALVWLVAGMTMRFNPPFKVICRTIAPLRPLLAFSERSIHVLAGNAQGEKQDNIAENPNSYGFSKDGILREIVQFGNETVKDILTARLDVVDLDVRTPFPDVLKIIAENNYSRIPVYANTHDNIVGILYIKDLLPYIGRGKDFHWTNLLRPHFCVPETKKINNLLREFQTKKIHIAVVIDEYGGVSGIVTLEDIIEEIVGEINDEFDDDRGPYVQLNSNTYIFDAKVSLQNFCKLFEIDETFFDDFGEEGDTLAGVLLAIIGDLPRKHQTVRFKQFVFVILNVDERHISKVKVTLLQTSD